MQEGGLPQELQKNPLAVLISDIHYSLNTLEVADKALRQAINKAEELRVPLIVAGDLHDTKANLRAECVNAMLDAFGTLLAVECFILIGNHDLINEKSVDNSLEFLENLNYKVHLVRGQMSVARTNLELIAYHSNVEKLKERLKGIHSDTIVIMHQGIQGSNSGEYIRDHTAINKSDVAGLRVISGHYHQRQTLELPERGQWDYIGNPYSVNFGEANDPEKGFQVLYNDGSLEFVPTNLRKHVVFEIEVPGDVGVVPNISPGDWVWLKVKGTKADLLKVDKNSFKALYLSNHVKLDLIPTDSENSTNKNELQGMKTPDILDKLIRSKEGIDEQKAERLRFIWRDIFGSNK
jgi:DNA repair exonuclease SbcCD nuclease subunit